MTREHVLEVDLEHGLGPVLTVRFGLSSNVRSVLPASVLVSDLPIGAFSLLDTGATTTTIALDLAHRLNLMPVGATRVTGIGGSQEVDKYLVDVEFAFGPTFSSVPVIAARIKAAHLEAIIGRDILDRGCFTYDGYGKRMRLAFPVLPSDPKLRRSAPP